MIDDFRPEPFTPRQAWFLSLSANGFSRNEIANQNAYSVWTVKMELDIARNKVGAKSLAQAVARAIAFEMLVADHEGNVSPAVQWSESANTYICDVA